MLDLGAIRAGAAAATLVLMISVAAAFDENKYPDWSGQWLRPPGVGFQWDPTKPPGLGQQAPLTPEYQAVLEASLADQAVADKAATGSSPVSATACRGWWRSPGQSSSSSCQTSPMWTSTLFYPAEDGRSWPAEIEPSFAGYSIGKWLDTDGDGRFDTLEVETRNFKGPRVYEPSGIPLADDNQSVVFERIYIDKADPDILHNDITTVDHALTRPWTVNKRYRRDRNVIRHEDNCTENNRHVIVGNEDYFVGADGYLMPSRKDQPPPDFRYFNRTKK
jgi:hypothetical protein